ncbi:hypothetical protein MNB_SV-10-840 [hydrothermal vent metagenome]|uniref:SbsA Ig-like domain-containing protein n=1 Tax=hydrothermal vent metagenome TaxID=652676 RepID=A0A1W1CLH1_9ZZZZ
MKKFTGLLLFLLAGMLFAETIDVTKSEGTNQSIITSLTPAPASPEVDANITVEAVFNEALNPMSTMHSVTLKHITGKKKRWGMFGFGISRSKNKTIQGSITYDQNENTLYFTPDQPLEVGFYKVSFRHLMKKVPGMHMRIKPIVYHFYVPEVINGFKLPPEPDEDKNNATLLGIDFNHNGIRDDVERWIIIHYANDLKYPKTKTAIALQYAWASQKILENPTMESKKYLDDAIDCQYYWFHTKTQNMSGFEAGQFHAKNKVFNDPILKDKIYNNRERIEQKFRFNAALSGNIFDGRNESIENCRTNIDELGE